MSEKRNSVMMTDSLVTIKNSVLLSKFIDRSSPAPKTHRVCSGTHRNEKFNSLDKK